MTSTFAKTEKSTLPSVAEDPRWARIVARDKTADGHLWYSVYTTGVYCRPPCPSRTANPNNVQLHDTLESAKATGFRPCKTVQSRRPFDRVRECSSRREGLQNNRGERRGACAGGAGGRGRSQPNLFPSLVQGRHRCHAQRL